VQWWRIARDQGGVVDARQLREAGLTDRRQRGMVTRGELVVVLPGVFRSPSTPLTVRGRQFAAMLWSDGVVSFGTASAMWDQGVPDDAETVDVSVLDRVSRNGHPDFVRVHRVLLSPEDVVEVDGLRITSRSRTTLDMVGVLPWSAARSLFERGFQQGWFTLADLDRRLEREKGRTGNVKLRAFREEVTPGAQFEFERRFHKLLRRHGIIGWEPQFVIRTATDGLVTVDIAFPEHKLIIELDGWSTHGGHERFGRDRKRDRRTLITGWRTVRYVWGDLDDPASVIAEIVCLLAA
jgi:very-short-patch-repair endonuclease